MRLTGQSRRVLTDRNPARRRQERGLSMGLRFLTWEATNLPLFSCPATHRSLQEGKNKVWCPEMLEMVSWSVCLSLTLTLRVHIPQGGVSHSRLQENPGGTRTPAFRRRHSRVRMGEFGFGLLSLEPVSVYIFAVLGATAGASLKL